jgi:hypothetical protein
VDPMKRRTLLGLVSTGVATWWASRALGEDRAAPHKSLVVLWLDGGPSQLETFDPKPGTRIGGPTRAIRTAAEGVILAEGFDALAEEMRDITLIRSLTSKEGDHERATRFMKTGYRPDPTVVHPSLGAICSAELPAEGLDIPRYVSILSPPNRASLGGYLGAAHDAFRIGDPAEPIQDLLSPVDEERGQRRLDDLRMLEARFAERDARTSRQARHAERTEAAQRTMRSPELDAFRVDDESWSVRRRYGDTPFGRGCLAARRLVETGVPCVEVSLGGWDTHTGHFEATPPLVDALDRGFAALVADLRERDLLRSTVVLCTGEFGRTPRINAADGRDHWPQGFSLALAGGGLRGGMAIGETSDETGLPADPTSVEDVYATVLHVLGVEHDKTIDTPAGRPVKLSAGTVLSSLLA